MSLPIWAEAYVSGKALYLMLKILVIILIIPTILSREVTVTVFSLSVAHHGIAAGTEAADQDLGQIQHSFSLQLHHEEVNLHWGGPTPVASLRSN